MTQVLETNRQIVSMLSDKHLLRSFEEVSGELDQKQLDQLRELYLYVQEGTQQNREIIQYLLTRVSDGSLVEGKNGLIHQVTEAVIKKIRAGQVTGSIRPYLLRELYTATFKHSSVSNSGDPETESIDDPRLSELPSNTLPEMEAVTPHEKTKLLLALNAIQHAQAVAIVLYRFERLTLEEVGVVVAELFPGIDPSLGASKSRIFRAQNSLQRVLPTVDPKAIEAYVDKLDFEEYDLLDYVLNGLDLTVFQRLMIEKKQTGKITLPEKYTKTTQYTIEEAAYTDIVDDDQNDDVEDPPEGVLSPVKTEGATAGAEPPLEELLAVAADEVAAGIPPAAELDAATLSLTDTAAVPPIEDSAQETRNTRTTLQALEALFSSEYALLLNFTKKRFGIYARGGTSAEDLLHDAFTKLYQIVLQGRSIRNIRPYFFAVVRSTIVDFYRNAQKISQAQVVHAKELPPYHVDTADQALRNIAEGENGRSNTSVIPRSKQVIQPTFNYFPKTARRKKFTPTKVVPREVVTPPAVMNIDELKPQPATPVQLEIFRTENFTRSINQASETVQEPVAVPRETTHLQASFEELLAELAREPLPETPLEQATDEEVAFLPDGAPIAPRKREQRQEPPQQERMKSVRKGRITRYSNGKVVEEVKPKQPPGYTGPLTEAKENRVTRTSSHPQSQANTSIELTAAEPTVKVLDPPKNVRVDDPILQEVYDRYEARIYSYIYRRTGNESLAEDLTAQVFLKMLEAIRGDKGWHSSFSGWLYRIAHNAVIDYYRERDRQQQVHLDDISETVATDYSPVKAAENNLDAEKLRVAISRLTEEQAEVINVRFLEGYSISEVAEILDKTEGSVKALQYRAVQNLRQLLQHADFS